MQAYIAPPIAAVFLIGILWQRVNARGAMASLVTGFVIGALRLIAELGKDGLSGVALAFAEINFLHFAVLLFIVCSAVLVGLSLTAPAPDNSQLAGLTFATPEPPQGSAELPPSEPCWRRHDLILSGVVLGLVVLIWIYFSPLVQS